MKLFFILISITILMFSGCTTKNYTLMQTDTPIEAKARPATGYMNFEYTIKPHDRLQITAYNYPELIPTNMNEHGILVDSSGYISLPLIHRVKVSGLTQSQAGKKLERLYKKYLKEPSFTVEVMNKRIYVLGEVKKPGPIQLDHEYMTLLEAISTAGDFTDNAIRDNVIIASRAYNGKMNLRKVDLTNFNSMQNSDMLLHPNDIVYVQPDSWKKMKVSADNLSAVTKVISSAAAPYLIFK